ncbi:hypothetical protein J7E88_11560 [Streptomyces sp. ISL-10]|uniref:hypothetical protein n=1 Tax=Streptomyces sp. ISL-10 TaxID=2819172 RepID=UPI001BE56C5F|nr:hypothetical protein [Streptomyces sp. ISL-10]MBT2365925.1 hypothetical protein [Streptomyces sp. ISL-10]
MRDKDATGPAESGLTTEDIARGPGGGTGEGQDAGPPVYPGEETGGTADTGDTGFTADAAGTVTAPETGGAPAPAEEEAESTSAATPGDAAEEELLAPEDKESFRTRWQAIQNDFVDDPREAVHSADALVADVMQKLAATFAERREGLEEQWNRGEQADTESLRVALREYRSFFNRLLAT